MSTTGSDNPSGATPANGSTHVHAPYYDDAAARQAAGSTTVRPDASIGTLLKELAHEVPALLRNEVALAKSEMREQMGEMQKGIGAIATGGAVALAGLVVVLMAVVYALSNIMAPWLAALLVGGAALVVGYMMVASGREKLKNGSLRPERTAESLRKDRNVIGGGTP